jgi:two-component system, NarL family, sensor histidine kinase UhpB
MRQRTLLTQVLAVNTVLVAVTAFVAAVVARERLNEAVSTQGMLLLGLAVLAVVLLNSLLLRRRLEPMGQLVSTMSTVDLASPGTRAEVTRGASTEVQRLTADFNRMMGRLEHERRESGRAVLRAQEQERTRIAQDLHDEVNQALTAILLRLEALSQDSPPDRVDEVAELKRLVNQAMEELLNLARQLRPTALDDHGLMPAIEAQLKRFSARTGIEVRVSTEGEPETLPEDVQTAVYRILQEALANIGRHAGATAVSVEMEVEDERLELHIRDDGVGFDPSAVVREVGDGGPGAGLGLSGMVERARLAGGELDVRSAPGGGTTVTLRIGRLVRVAS